MSSEQFYGEIEKTGQFKYYSFAHNYRQTTYLQDFCTEYRESILKGSIDECNVCLSNICEKLPEFNTVGLRDFQENTLDFILSQGNVGILTRSNAEAMTISNLFQKKNIPHLLQRRLTDNYLHGWIAVMFNQLPCKSYNEEDFVHSFNTLFDREWIDKNPSEIWNAMNQSGRIIPGRVPVSDMIRNIRNNGKNAGLYIDIPDIGVTVSTIHRSKGREYDSVFILDNLISENTDSSEEHRVNYVALSRARKRMYKVSIPKLYFKTLDNRRCFSVGRNFRTGKSFLSRFEIGRPDDFSGESFSRYEGVQEYIRRNIVNLRDKEVYLKRMEDTDSGFITYSLVLRENDMILGETGQSFADDLGNAIRKTKNLPWHAPVRDYLYPKRFNDIYIMDIASTISMVRGNEIGVREFDGLVTWNIIIVGGYAKAEY